MGNIRRYTVDYDWKAELEVEIDHDVMTAKSFMRLTTSGATQRVVLISMALC